LHLKALAQADTLQRFQREARVTALLSHLKHCGCDATSVWPSKASPIWLWSSSTVLALAEYLKQYGRPPLREVIDIFSQACSGLEHAHQKDIVHRDIKPSNLMLIHNGDDWSDR
jgi:serine/threonine protein kinase